MSAGHETRFNLGPHGLRQRRPAPDVHSVRSVTMGSTDSARRTGR
jgi:hypothetical protein